MSHSKVVVFCDSTLNDVRPRGIHPNCVKIKCPTSADLQRLSQEFPSDSDVQGITVATGINDLRDSDGPEAISSIQSSMLRLQDILPRASLQFSEILTKSDHPLCSRVKNANADMKKFCEDKFMTFVYHKDIVNNPVLLPDGIHPSSVDGASQLAADLRYALPRQLARGNRRSFSQNRRGSQYKGPKR